MASKPIKESDPALYASMLAAYCGGMTFTELSKSFGRARSTIVSMAHRYGWKVQRDAYIKRLERRAKSALEQVQAENLRILDKMKNALLEEILPDITPSDDPAEEAARRGTGIPVTDRFRELRELIREQERILGSENEAMGTVHVEQLVVIQTMPKAEREAIKRKLLEDLGMVDPKDLPEADAEVE